MAKKSVKITETVLRDGQQSLAATRMRIVDMLPIPITGFFSAASTVEVMDAPAAAAVMARMVSAILQVFS